MLKFYYEISCFKNEIGFEIFVDNCSFLFFMYNNIVQALFHTIKNISFVSGYSRFTVGD